MSLWLFQWTCKAGRRMGWRFHTSWPSLWPTAWRSWPQRTPSTWEVSLLIIWEQQWFADTPCWDTKTWSLTLNQPYRSFFLFSAFFGQKRQGFFVRFFSFHFHFRKMVLAHTNAAEKDNQKFYGTFRFYLSIQFTKYNLQYNLQNSKWLCDGAGVGTLNMIVGGKNWANHW